MTIRKGEEWGIRIIAPQSCRYVANDAQLAQLQPFEFGVLTGGDIHYTLGAPSSVQPGNVCTQLEIDAMQNHITLSDGSVVTLLASSKIEIGSFRPSVTRQRYICITNGGIVDMHNIAPRAHPNDGVLDCMHVDAGMPLRARLTALTKSKSGTHIPHPDIAITRGETFSFHRKNQKEKLSIDGVVVPRWSSIVVNVLPDYWKILV